MSSNKNLIWVVIMNTNDCRIYAYHKKPAQLVLIKEITHPENRLRDIDLTSDKPGRYHANESAHGTFSQHSDPKEIKIDALSQEIASELEHGRIKNAYGDLFIVGLPHMHGMLFQHLNKHVKELVSHSIEKNVQHMTDHELLDFLHTHSQG